MTEEAIDWRAYIDQPEVRGEVTAAAATAMFLARMDERADLAAVVTVTAERAYADAERADDARKKGRPLPLDGMPILLKDNIDVGGYPCRVGSPLFEDRVPSEDATVARKISAAGGVILGKTTLHELVYGATTDSQFYGRTHNPWDAQRTVGGSSGGSAAAAAAGLCVTAIGTDTGGSIRLPAHLNGVVGLRPTYGSVSTHGVIPIGPALDTVGPLARRAQDVAAVHDVIVGPDWDDEHSVELPRRESRPAPRAVVPGPRTLGELDPAAEQAFRHALDELRALDVTVEVVELDGFAQAREDARTINRVEAWTRYRHDLGNRPDLFSAETAERLRSGHEISGAEVVEASWRILKWRRDLRRLLAEHDLLALPVVPVATPLASPEGMIETTALLTSYTLPVSAAWVPAVSVPIGMADQMPAGLQVAAAPGRESDLLDLAVRLQQRTAPPWPPE